MSSSIVDLFNPSMSEKLRMLSLVGEEAFDRNRWVEGYEKPKNPAAIDFPEVDFDQRVLFEDALKELSEQIRQQLNSHLSPYSFGVFVPAPAFPAVLGDLFASSLNLQLSGWIGAPAANEIETKLIRWIAKQFGFDQSNAHGHFTNGGGEANTSGLLVALNRKFPLFESEGARSIPQGAAIYSSDQAHRSWIKAAKATGLGTGSLRSIASNSAGKMDPVELRNQIREDQARGLSPFFVVSTVGTTTSGSIDNLAEISEICEENDLHHHVDAAWGGAICFSSMWKKTINGIELADSITFDPHKWLSVPFSLGVFLAKDHAAISRAFGVDVDYFPTDRDRGDPYATSAQWSRRFNGAKLYLALRVCGKNGLAELIDRQIELGFYLKNKIEKTGWQIHNDTALPVVCFTDPLGADPELIRSAIWEKLGAFITTPGFKGRKVLRAGIINFETEKVHVDMLVDELCSLRERYRK